MQNKQSFADFTNLYSLSKTLRFELKPIGQTQAMLDENKIFEVDENRKKAYDKTKPYFDRLHREFINESLSNAQLKGISEYFETFKQFRSNQNNKDLKELINKQQKFLRHQIVTLFDENGKHWATTKYAHLKIKKKNLDILFDEQVFYILKERYGSEKETQLVDKETGAVTSIFDNWKGFTGYFTKFFETRKNFYKSDGTSTALATRIIDQNLNRFFDNLETFHKIKDKIDVKEVEIFFKLKADNVFSIDFYNQCLLQNGIDKYNDFLGGQTLENGEKQKGINEIINKYRQDNKDQKLPFLKKLDKQILSEKDRFINEIESKEEFFQVLTEFYQSATVKVTIIKTLLNDFVHNTDKYKLEKIYLTKEAFNTIANKWTDETQIFEDNLDLVLKNKKITAKQDFIPLAYIKEALEVIEKDRKFFKDRYYNDPQIGFFPDQSYWEQFLAILNFEFMTHFQRVAKDKITGKKIELGYFVFEKRIKELLDSDPSLNSQSKIIIKEFADEVLHIFQMAKYFALEKKREWKGDYYQLDDQFYNHIDYGFKDQFYENAYEKIVQPYNKIRNYLTKKPYSDVKWKLNFGNPTLANGWDKNKEADNTAVILKKDGNYYLGVMKKGKNKIFSDQNKEKYKAYNSAYYEKLVYKLFPDPSKMFPKVCFSKKGLNFFQPSEEILRIYKNNEFKKGNTFSISSMQKLIAFYIDCLGLYEGWKHYEFKNIKDVRQYKENIGEFYADVAESGYKLWFEKISEEYITQKNQLGELFLFQIYNKDFAKKTTGRKNLHTIYFEELFSQTNIDNNFPFKLNGQAELFYRPKSLEKIEEKRNFKRSIVNKKRYTQNKIFFHVPITLNRTSENIGRFNVRVNNFLANNSNVNIVGVDRGEKNLAYYSIIKQNGEVLKSGSLNIINGVDYHALLTDRAQRREQERRNWQDVESIKDLKRGYISQVVHELVSLAIKYNAIIVMEDLNMRFKQIRGGIEKSTYQQLEKALIEKLNFLVNKEETDSNQAGNLLNAYQLTAPFKTFKDMGKQTGIIFYTQASYTSKIDPLTGWRPNIYLRYSNAKQAKADILMFTNIYFSEKKDRFEFTYDLEKIDDKRKDLPIKTEWTVCSNVERFSWEKSLNNNKGGYVHYPIQDSNGEESITSKLKKLFMDFGIDLTDIKTQIESLDTNKKDNANFFRKFIFYFQLICQIRNTQVNKSDDGNDFIFSPVEPFFDSRFADKFRKNLPKNGDENGAYNIARKGLIILHKISDYFVKEGSTDKISWKDLSISQTEWDNFTTDK